MNDIWKLETSKRADHARIAPTERHELGFCRTRFGEAWISTDVGMESFHIGNCLFRGEVMAVPLKSTTRSTWAIKTVLECEKKYVYS